MSKCYRTRGPALSLAGAFPQRPAVFSRLSLAKPAPSRFFDHAAHVAGTDCVVIGMGRSSSPSRSRGRFRMMVLPPAEPLFDWESLEDSPSLQTIKDLLATLPDGKLLDSLRRARGKGRNDYPVHVLWGVVVLRVALRHVTTEAVLAEVAATRGCGGSSASSRKPACPGPGTSRGSRRWRWPEVIDCTYEQINQRSPGGARGWPWREAVDCTYYTTFTSGINRPGRGAGVAVRPRDCARQLGSLAARARPERGGGGRPDE